MSRAFNSGIKLSESDAAIVKGMLHRGDRQHDIASWFGVNSGRIAEISVRYKFSHVIMKRDNLPPPGPYLTGKQLYELKLKVDEQNKKLNKLVDTIERSDTQSELKNIVYQINRLITEF